MYFLYILLLGTFFVRLENAQTISFNPKDPDDILSEMTQELSPNCGDLLHLSSIDFSRTGIQNISPKNLNSTFIKCVNLAENNINVIPEGIFNSESLPNMIYLNLSYNQIPINNFTSFANSDKLQILVLDKNALTWTTDKDIFKSILPLRALERLYLRKNSIPSMKLGFLKSFPRLTHLYLSDNEITDVIFAPAYSSGIFDLIPHLHFERNSIFYFTSNYLNKNTISLFLDGNKLEQFRIRPFSVDQYNLQVLSLSDCQLTSFQVFDIPSLKSLDLSNNLFDDTNLSLDMFDSLSGLKNLSLSYNLLTQIPLAIEQENLEFLLLSHNKITAIRSASFVKCKNLRILSLRGNRISHIEANAFLSLKNLEKLDLAQNKINFMPSLWTEKLSNLRYLNLNFNDLDSAKALSLPREMKLEDLHLRNNTITYLTGKLLASLPENVTIHVAPIYQ